MNDIFKKTVSVLFITYTIFFLVFCIYSIIILPGDTLLPRLHWKWVITNSFILFIAWFVTMHISGILLVFSLLASSSNISGSSTFYNLIKNSLILFIILTALYFFMISFFKPAVENNLTKMERKSDIALSLWDRIENTYSEGDREKAQSFLEDYLILFPNDKNAASLYDKLVFESRESVIPEEPAPPMHEEEHAELSAASYVKMAETFYNDGDYFSAHYYASLALELNDQRDDARRLAARSWEHIKNPEDIEENNIEAYNKKKTRAYQLLKSGSYLEAYNQFNNLLRDNPSDNEARQFLERAKEKLKDNSYFVSSTQEALKQNGKYDIFFMNTPKSKQFFYFKKIVYTITGVYVLEPEIMELNNSGNINYLVKSPYGKIDKEGYLNLQGVSGGETTRYIIPDYIIGEKPEELANLFLIGVPLNNIQFFTLQDIALDNIPLTQLYQISKQSSLFGFSPLKFRYTIINKILAPFTFLFLSFIAIAVGWKYRSTYISKPSPFLYILIPIVPFMIHLLLDIFNFYIINVISGFFLLYISLPVTVLVMIIIEALLFIVAMISLANQVITAK
jgi:tetratricopeptide (TPR) repeat protein